MKNLISKLTSRKFLTCIAGVVLGVCMVFGIDEGTINIIAGAITSIVSVVTYICTEGKIDVAAVDKIKDAADKTQDAIDAVGNIEE